MDDVFGRSLRDRFDPAREAGRTDPAQWVRHRLGAHAWSKQVEIMQSVQDHTRTAVPSCHGAGKSQVAAWIIARFIDIHDPGTAFVVTTAPRAHQVRTILWRYLRRIHKAAGLPGSITEGMIPEWKIDGEIVGFGRKPADLDGDSFQGLHEYRLLVVFDEACGVPKSLYDAAESLMTSANCHWLCIGNPDDRSSFFHSVCTSEPGWNVIPISAFDTPNLTGEPVPQDAAENLVQKAWVEDKQTRWGETSPLYRAKVLGQWVDADDGLIPLSWVRAANARWHAWKEAGSVEPQARRIIGVDPAWLGTDKSAIVVRQGNIILFAKAYGKLDTGQLTSVVRAELAKVPRSIAVVDAAGVGAGVIDQLRAAGESVIAFNGAKVSHRRDSSGTWGFPNDRSASWYLTRECLDPTHGQQLAIPDDEDLINDLTAPTYTPIAGGKLKVEPKADMRKRLRRSPDLGDALAYALWIDTPGNRTPRSSRHRPRARAVQYANAQFTGEPTPPGGLQPWQAVPTFRIG